MPKMQALTIRFSAEEMEKINEIARETNTPKAEVVRATVTKNKIKNKVVYVNISREQYEQIKGLEYELLTELQRIRTELHRIGVNYNQVAKRANYKHGNSYEEIKQQVKAQEQQQLNAETLQRLMNELTEATKRTGEALCHTVG